LNYSRCHWLQVQPNSFAEGRYVVLNSGHTFHKKELASLNHLHFPRLGDWAIDQVGGKMLVGNSETPPERVVRASFFDERWRFSE
jgi:hypothetical protein